MALTEARFERPAGPGAGSRGTKELEHTINRFLFAHRWQRVEWDLRIGPVAGTWGPEGVQAVVLRAWAAEPGRPGARFGVKCFLNPSPRGWAAPGGAGPDPEAQARAWLRHAGVEALDLRAVGSPGAREAWVLYRLDPA